LSIRNRCWRFVVTACYVFSALLAAACCYLAASHQRLAPRLQHYKVTLRASGGALCVVAILSAAQLLGWWAGAFAVLTTFMLGCVVLPYVDAWRSHGEEPRVE
jgi:hypothetical protein